MLIVTLKMREQEENGKSQSRSGAAPGHNTSIARLVFAEDFGNEGRCFYMHIQLPLARLNISLHFP